MELLGYGTRTVHIIIGDHPRLPMTVLPIPTSMAISVSLLSAVPRMEHMFGIPRVISCLRTYRAQYLRRDCQPHILRSRLQGIALRLPSKILLQSMHCRMATSYGQLHIPLWSERSRLPRTDET